MRLYRIGMYIILGLSILWQGTLVGQLTSLNMQGTTRAVIVGISEYQDKSIGDLRFAHRDAEAFAAYLQSEVGGGLGEEQFRLLTNENATLGQISAALEWLQETSQSGDQAVIYFSGHGDAVKVGSREGYILCHDAVVRRYTMSGALPLNTLQNVISTLSIDKEAQVLFLADACRSGGLENRMGVGGFGQDLARQYSHELKLLSCQPHELSHEGEQWGGGRGVFSYYLIEGLMGFADEDGDEVITLMELEQYVKRKVSLDMRPVSQVPIARGEQTKGVAFVNSKLLAELKQQKNRELPLFKSAAPRANVFDNIFSQSDSSKQHYLFFIQAIERKDFLFPEEDCAEKWFGLLMGNPDISAIHTELRRTYAAALQDDAQQVLNKYLKMDHNTLSTLGHQTQIKYINYPHYLKRASELIEGHDFRYKKFKSREALFQGIVDYYALGSLKAKNDLEPVLNNWHSSLELESDNPAASFFLMDLHARKRMDYDSTLYYFNKAVSLDSLWGLPYAHLGYYLSTKFKKYELAENILKQGIQIDSSDTYMLKTLATSLFYRNNIEESLYYIKRSIEIDSTDYLAWANLGAINHKKGDLDAALQAYHKSIDINPDQYQGHNMIGLLYYAMKFYDKAEYHYHQAHLKEPRDIPLLGRLSLLYLDWKKFEALEKMCHSIESLDEENFRHWYYRACMHAETGNLSKSKECLEKALMSNPEVSTIIRCKELASLVSNNKEFSDLISKYENRIND